MRWNYIYSKTRGAMRFGKGLKNMQTESIYKLKTKINIMEIAPRISIDEKVRFGKPVITGTRIPIDLIIGKLAGGMAYKEVMDEYEITREDILAVLNYLNVVQVTRRKELDALWEKIRRGKEWKERFGTSAESVMKELRGR